jgi:Fe2+ or Zn2+ uptake regulation protein
MLPIRANANVMINENKPSDAREVLPTTIEIQCKPIVLSTVYRNLAGLDKDEPYLDKAPNTKGIIKQEIYHHKQFQELRFKIVMMPKNLSS